jgi:hypothetical protein
LYVNNTGSVLNFLSLATGQGIEFIPSSTELTIVNDLPFDPTANQSVSGTWTFTNAQIEMPALANVATSDVVFFNPSSGLLTYGAYTAFSTSANYVLTGNWTFDGGFTVNNSSAIAVQTSSASGITLTATAGPINISANGANTLSGSSVVLSSAVVTAPSLNTASTSNVLYYNPTGGVITYAAAPSSSGLPQNNVTVATQQMAVNNGYVTNYTGGMLGYTLPVTSAVGAVLQVTGNSAAGWQIEQNAGQNIQVGSISSTSGTGGYVESRNQYDGITLLCTVANTTWVATSVVGTLLIN